MNLSYILFGLVLAILGRKLFWLFVGLAGFLFGMTFSGIYLSGCAPWIVFVVSICVGVIGALAAIFLERLAFALAGFYAGAFLAITGTHAFGIDIHSLILFMAGGIIGAIIAAWIMDWAIIVLSALVGAGAVVIGINLPPTIGAILFVILAAAGIAIQSRFLPGADND